MVSHSYTLGLALAQTRFLSGDDYHASLAEHPQNWLKYPPSLHISSIPLHPVLSFLCILTPSLCPLHSISWGCLSWHIPLSPTCPLLPPHYPFLSSLSCVQIDQPEFDIPLKQEQEQKIYAQVRWSSGQRFWPLTLGERRGPLVPVTEVTPPPDRAGILDLPESAGNLAGRRPRQGARTCLLVHLHYLPTVPVSEAPGAAAGTGEALPAHHYRPTAGALNRGLEEDGYNVLSFKLPWPPSFSSFPEFLSISNIFGFILSPNHPPPQSPSNPEGGETLLPSLLLFCSPQLLFPSSKEMAPAIDWLSCLQATFTPMSLSPSQTIVVHNLDYLKDMSQLVEEQLLSHRFAPGGIREVQGRGKSLKTQRSQEHRWLGEWRLVRASQEDGRDSQTHGTEKGWGWQSKIKWRKDERLGEEKTHMKWGIPVSGKTQYLLE